MKESYLESNPLMMGIEEIRSFVQKFGERVKAYYFYILSTRYSCPKCARRINLTDSSQTSCICGLSFDPTIEFQRSTCCLAGLKRKNLHYTCSACGKITPSIFLFDEKTFDPEYFKGRMQAFRENERKRKQEAREMLKMAISGSLCLTEEIDLNALPGLTQDLNQFMGIGRREELALLNQTLSLEEYRKHLLNQLGTELMFNSFTSLALEERRDKIYRFITLIFMEQEREVNLFQYGNDILVERT
jgi:hypothetical protein